MIGADCLAQIQFWYRLCLAILGVFVFGLLFVMLLGYKLKWRKQQIELSKRTEQLEKKNGSEQKQINELKEEIEELKRKMRRKKC